MKNSFFLILLVISSNLCFAACTKNTKRIVEQDFSEDKKVSSFEDNIEAFINNDIEVINKLQKKEIAPCESISSLLQYYLQDKDEETCIRVVKLAVENKGEFVDSMDFSNPLIESCKLNYVELTRYLLSTKAIEYINYPFSQYAPALFWAIKNENIELVELLLQNGADPNCETHYSRTYMNEIDNFIASKTISFDNAIIIKHLLIKYGYNQDL